MFDPLLLGMIGADFTIASRLRKVSYSDQSASVGIETRLDSIE